MQSSFDTRFFQILTQIAAAELGADHDCTVATRAAASTEDPLVMRNAKSEIDALSPEIRDRLMAQTHRLLATDLSAIWDQMPNAGQTDLAN